MWKQLKPALLMTVVLTGLTGLVYPALVTAACQALFPTQANGSLIYSHGRIVGSALLAQDFQRPDYFHPRPSAAGPKGFDPTASGGSNLGPTSKALADRLATSVAAARAANPQAPAAIPADLLTTSASGLDPHISPASAAWQLPRVAAARHLPVASLQPILDAHTSSRWLGLLGEPRVNVLELNLALDAAFPQSGAN